MENDELLMTSGVARELELSGRMVIELERSGKLPAIKTANGTRLFRRADVEQLKRQRQEARQR